MINIEIKDGTNIQFNIGCDIFKTSAHAFGYHAYWKIRWHSQVDSKLQTASSREMRRGRSGTLQTLCYPTTSLLHRRGLESCHGDVVTMYCASLRLELCH